MVLIDKRISAVRAFSTPTEVVEPGEDGVILSDGRRISFGELKELAVTSSFVFVYPALFR